MRGQRRGRGPFGGNRGGAELGDLSRKPLSFKALFNAKPSLSRTGFGVPLGANSPYQTV